MKAPLLSLLGLVLATLQPAQAQMAGLRPGYRLLPGGDTVRGFVNDRGGRRNALECHFYATRDGADEVFTPATCAGYGFLDEPRQHYTTLTPPASVAEPNVSPLVVKPYFMEVLARGTASLYYLTGKGSQVYYYFQATPTAPLQELRVGMRQVSSTQTRTLNYYQQTLELAFLDCPAMQREAKATAFTLPDLVKVVSRYNQCRAVQTGVPASLAASPKRNSRIVVEAYAGASVVSALALDSYQQVLASYHGTRTQGSSPLAGGQVLFNNPRLSRVLWFSIGLQAGYRHFTTTDTYGVFGTTGPAKPVYVQGDYKALAFRIPVLMRFVRPNGTFRPYAEVGVDFTTVSEQTNSLAFTGAYVDEQFWLINTRSTETGLLASVGCYVERPKRHRLGACLRYVYEDGPTTGNEDVVTNIRSAQLLLVYGLSK